MLKINTSGRGRASDIKLLRRIACENQLATMQRLKTSTSGLPTLEAQRRLKELGPNEITSNKKCTKLHYFIEAFMAPFTLVLFVLAILDFFTGYLFAPSNAKDLSTVILLLSLVAVSGVVSYIQNIKTNETVESLINKVPAFANVRRDDTNQDISTSDIVVGDIINLTAGDVVPADIRLLKGTDLICSASSLNGEAHSVEKVAHRKPAENSLDSYLDYPNVLYEGTTVVEGSGMGVVFATGNNTSFGRLAHSISKSGINERTFDLGIKRISEVFLSLAAIIAPVVILINILTRGDWSNAVVAGLVTAIGLTIELLPAIAINKLVNGSVQLSQNEILSEEDTEVFEDKNVSLKKYFNLSLQDNLKVLKLSYIKSYFEDGVKNLMDQAIIKVARQDLDTDQIDHSYQKIQEIPFDFKRRRMSVAVSNNKEKLLITEGTPAEMLAVSNRVENDGKIKSLNKKRRSEILEKVQKLQSKGLKVFLIGYKKNFSTSKITTKSEKDLTLVGFLVFDEQPMAKEPATINSLKRERPAVSATTIQQAQVMQAK